MTPTTTPAPVLHDGALYLGDNGRVMCSASHCAGVTARLSGRDLSGARVTPVTRADLAEWATYDLGAMRCECGRITLTA